MVAVRFDPDRQLHLADRKAVAARLCRLVGLTALETDEAPSDWKSFANDLHGLIDEVTVFDRVLSPAEIQAMANAGAAGLCRD